MRSLHRSRKLLAGTVVSATALLATLTPAVAADNPAQDAAKKAQLHALLAAIDMTGSALDSGQESAISRHYALLDLLRQQFPEVARKVSDPRQLEVTAKEAVVTEDGEIVSPETGKPLGKDELAAIEPPADAQASEPSEEQETPEETDADPNAPAEGDAALAAAAVRGGKWKMTHITYTHRSYFGNTIFKYHTYARFNYKGGKVRAWGKRYDNTSNEDSGVDVGGRMMNRKSKVPASSATSIMKRKVTFKIPIYGEYATVYPWAKVKVYGSGRTKIAGTGA
ncbi:hypothetical protein [Streptomyces syringium]|uniref:Uncharacterized protein n=1 Tax=Streptomyces syringium TaxID=76729 RepID=A0ABS4Y1W6_9ACTN|nr:hypothetical protein [Streptomyces syringium]MBP2402772.1 hypothetical protein [Streptomyces syringium]